MAAMSESVNMEWSALSLTAERVATGGCSDDDSEDLNLLSPSRRSSQGPVGKVLRSRGVVRAAIAGAVAAAVLLCVVGSRGAGPGVRGAVARGAVGLSDAGETSVSVATEAAVDAVSDANEAAKAPKEHLNDGNACGDDEEEHAGLCYDTCSGLTGGEYSFRTSAWTCCKEAVCPPFSFGCCKHNFGFCSGFDISGKMEANGKKICPHKPGACLKDEEIFLDVCYMKCSILTAGEYPYRVASATCCKKNDASCLVGDGLKDGLNGQSLTNATFNVGGGCHDDKNRTHCKPHEPDEALTEATSAPTTLAPTVQATATQAMQSAVPAVSSAASDASSAAAPTLASATTAATSMGQTITNSLPSASSLSLSN